MCIYFEFVFCTIRLTTFNVHLLKYTVSAQSPVRDYNFLVFGVLHDPVIISFLKHTKQADTGQLRTL